MSRPTPRPSVSVSSLTAQHSATTYDEGASGSVLRRHPQRDDHLLATRLHAMNHLRVSTSTPPPEFWQPSCRIAWSQCVDSEWRTTRPIGSTAATAPTWPPRTVRRPDTRRPADSLPSAGVPRKWIVEQNDLSFASAARCCSSSKLPDHQHRAVIPPPECPRSSRDRACATAPVAENESGRLPAPEPSEAP